MANTILQMITNRSQPTTPNLAEQAQQMIQNNDPAMAQAMAYVKDNGGNPKQALIKLMNEKGITPQAIFNQFGIRV